MTINTECWMTDTCKKYISGNCKESFCVKQFKMNFLYEESLLSLQQRNRIGLRPDGDGTDRDVFVKLKNIEDNVEDFISNGKNLYLFSTTCGNGKTAWATRLIQRHFDNIWHKSSLSCKALFISVPKYLIAIKDNINVTNDYVEHIKNHIYDVDMVVWDDIATKCATQFEHDNLLNLIDGRFNIGKSNVFTSNIHPSLLNEYVGDRLASRISGYSEILEFKGQDKRGLNK